jgi:outer membrane protein TolC
VRPELRRFGLDRDVLQEAELATRADTLPQVSGFASVGLNSFAFQNLVKPTFHNWNAGITVRWTLFDGFKTASAMETFASQRRQSELLEQSFRAELERELERVRGDWQRAVETLDVTTLTVGQAREAERVAEESFQYGAATVLDVLQSQQALQQSELGRVTANHDALAALAELKTLIGVRADAPHVVLTTDPVQRTTLLAALYAPPADQ